MGAVGTRLTQRKGTFRRIKKWGIAALSWSLPSIASLDGKSREMAEHVQQQVEKRRSSLGRWRGACWGHQNGCEKSQMQQWQQLLRIVAAEAVALGSSACCRMKK